MGQIDAPLALAALMVNVFVVKGWLSLAVALPSVPAKLSVTVIILLTVVGETLEKSAVAVPLAEPSGVKTGPFAHVAVAAGPGLFSQPRDNVAARAALPPGTPPPPGTRYQAILGRADIGWRCHSWCSRKKGKRVNNPKAGLGQGRPGGAMDPRFHPQIRGMASLW